MNVLIACNQEKAKKLTKYLHRYDASINIVGTPYTVEDMVRYPDELQESIDLAILDNNLVGGRSVDVCIQKQFKSPIVFTSDDKSDAYDAIKVGCLDFLLEPINYRDIVWSLKSLDQNQKIREDDRLISIHKGFKKRFIVKFGERIRYIKADEISCIFAEGKLAYICTKVNSRKYIIEHTLDELEKNHLDPDYFFRINRKFIVNIDSIEEVRNYANSRLKLLLKYPADYDMIVSRDKVNDFKSWLNL